MEGGGSLGGVGGGEPHRGRPESAARNSDRSSSIPHDSEGEVPARNVVPVAHKIAKTRRSSVARRSLRRPTSSPPSAQAALPSLPHHFVEAGPVLAALGVSPDSLLDIFLWLGSDWARIRALFIEMCPTPAALRTFCCGAGRAPAGYLSHKLGPVGAARVPPGTQEFVVHSDGEVDAPTPGASGSGDPHPA